MPTTRSTAATSTQQSQSLNLSPTARLQTRFEQKRRDLINTGLYLGDPTFKNSMDQRVTWRRIGREDRLVTKASADRLRAAQDERAAYAPSATGNDAEDEGDDEELDLPGLVDAKLSVVVFITPEDYWLVSCGLWKGPTRACQDFADMKLTCTGAAPTNEVFQPDFPVALTNLRLLMEKVTTPGFTNSNGVLVHGASGVDKIKFRHVLFEPLLDSDVEEAEEKNNDDGSDTASETSYIENRPEFRIENWPAHYDAAKEALRSMVSTHKVLPLPAYDLRGNLIPPSQYRKYLEGATARITFTLRHWSIPRRDGPASDTYVADIDSIRVLEPPRSQGATTPRKRKTPGRDPLETEMSPSKKAR